MKLIVKLTMQSCYTLHSDSDILFLIPIRGGDSTGVPSVANSVIHWAEG